MRRLLANRLVFATGAVVIAMAILFALLARGWLIDGKAHADRL